MQKPDFKQLKESISTVEALSSAFDSIYADKQNQENAIRDVCGHIAADIARKELANISVDEMKNAKA